MLKTAPVRGFFAACLQAPSALSSEPRPEPQDAIFKVSLLAATARPKAAKELDTDSNLAFYLAVFMTRDLTPASIAKALPVPRVLGTFITLALANAAKSLGDSRFKHAICYYFKS